MEQRKAVIKDQFITHLRAIRSIHRHRADSPTHTIIEERVRQPHSRIQRGVIPTVRCGRYQHRIVTLGLIDLDIGSRVLVIRKLNIVDFAADHNLRCSPITSTQTTCRTRRVGLLREVKSHLSVDNLNILVPILIRRVARSLVSGLIFATYGHRQHEWQCTQHQQLRDIKIIKTHIYYRRHFYICELCANTKLTNDWQYCNFHIHIISVRTHKICTHQPTFLKKFYYL